MLFLSLSSALAFSPAARPALPTGRSAVRPTMLLQPSDLDAAQSVLDAPTPVSYTHLTLPTTPYV